MVTLLPFRLSVVTRAPFHEQRNASKILNFQALEKKVVHLVPTPGIGGVERAAESMSSISENEIYFEVKYISPNSLVNNSRPLIVFREYIRTFRSIIALRPDVLVVSLWRAYLIGILVKLSIPGLRLVTFLHFPAHSHKLDSFLTLLAAILSSKIWADSQATALSRLPLYFSRRIHVISFVTRRVSPLPRAKVRSTFIFWGRLHKQKNLPRAITIFEKVLKAQPRVNFQFLIIGPDQGELGGLSRLVRTLSLQNNIFFCGARSFDEISEISRRATFFIQTSEQEGMGMAVVEAMQLGLVPVVTPVGEASHYAIHNYNSIVIKNDNDAVEDITSLLADTDRLDLIRANAIETWVKAPLYRDSVVEALRRL